ncbi:GPW/gp25 family protein [Nocardia sp. bgisy134]|uniref:GPW/gp25 family protein n=1 Tax=Nocardia sp. bgisy134 TaxID=3413789 RepID=UPI003D70695A
MNVDFPYSFDNSGRTATATDDDHLRDLIAQVLFTAPGERVMRPEFGSGLFALTFEPNSIALAATTQALIQAALQQWLGHLIALEQVEVTASDGTLSVAVSYVSLRTKQRRTDRLTVPGGGAA